MEILRLVSKTYDNTKLFRTFNKEFMVMTFKGNQKLPNQINSRLWFELTLETCGNLKKFQDAKKISEIHKIRPFTFRTGKSLS